MMNRIRRIRSKKTATLLTLTAMALSVTIIVSCTDRGNPTFRSDPVEGISTWTRNHAFNETIFTQFSDLQTTGINVYTPPGYDERGFSRPYPTLYILSPFRGDQHFYMHNNMQTVMNRMIASGEIEPMIVVTVNGSSNPFGGSFYSNYLTNGLWETLVTQSLVPFIDTQFNTFAAVNTGDPVLQKQLRAISGYEMAGYGAMRAMVAPNLFTGMASTTNFGSVSAISAPLFFTDNTYGFPRLFTQALGEWGSYSDIDSSTTAQATSFLLAAAVGFSPEDTAYSISPDSTGFFFVIDSINKIYDSSVIDTVIVFDTTIAVDTTIDTLVIPPDTVITVDTTAFPPDTNLIYNPPTDITFPTFPNLFTGEDATLRMYLPFDSTGAPYPLIWDLWKRHDMPNVLDSLRSGILAELSGNVMIMATQQAKFNHYDQDTMFVNKLRSMPTPVTTVFEEYSGYDGFADVGGSHYLFEVLPLIIKFHSDKIHPFVPPELQVQNYQAKY
jgi:Putative esterase